MKFGDFIHIKRSKEGHSHKDRVMEAKRRKEPQGNTSSSRSAGASAKGLFGKDRTYQARHAKKRREVR